MNEFECRLYQQAFKELGVTMTWNEDGILLHEAHIRPEDWHSKRYAFDPLVLDLAMTEYQQILDFRAMNAATGV